MKTIVSRTNALLVALTLAVTAAAVAAPVASAGDCNFTNYGVYVQNGDYNCESNDSIGNTYCFQGTGAGAGAGGAGKPSAAAGASTNCEGGSGTIETVASSNGDGYLYGTLLP